MLDIRWIRENPQALAQALEKRGQSGEAARSLVEDLIARDEARRAHLVALQEKQERRNAASKEIGNAMRAGDSARAEELKAEVAGIKEFIQSGEATERELDKALADALAVIPNLPLDDVPVGKDEADNVEVRRVGEPKRTNSSKEHFELGEALGQMDFERAAKLSGSRFTVLSGQLARLERALGQFMLDLHTTEHGYTEVQPPLLVNTNTMLGTGQLPKFEDDLFRIYGQSEKNDQSLREYTIKQSAQNEAIERLKSILSFTQDIRKEKDNDFLRKLVEEIEVNHLNPVTNSMLELGEELKHLMQRLNEATRQGVAERYLIPTAEVPLTNLVREEIVASEKLPLRYTALTPCFRSEAGSAGRDTRGMLRQHQFYKVEMVSITDQESSIAEHERMTECAETVLKRLGLPFRTVVLCTGDMGFGARKTYDIEVWLPGQNSYREISSCSVCGDFQARRMNARYRPTEGKGAAFVHTLNGSGVAVGRALIAVMENYQNQDGSISIPEALRPYMGGIEKIEAA